MLYWGGGALFSKKKYQFVCKKINIDLPLLWNRFVPFLIKKNKAIDMV
jgi:hypothetical protein